MKYDGNQILRSWVAGTLVKDFPALTAEQRRIVPLLAAGYAGEREMDAAGVEFVRSIKSTVGFAHNVPVLGSGLVDKAPADEPVIPWIFSTQKTDRDGSIILQDGWQLGNYAKNPVIDWSHSWARGLSHEPYARGENLRVEVLSGVPALVGDIRFAVNESEDAARRYRLAKAKFINAGSVGFTNLETRHVEDEEERQRMELGRFGVVHVRHELLEFSLCSVPAHPDAVQRALKDGLIDTKDAEYAVAVSDPTEKEWDKYMRARQRSFVDMGKARDVGQEIRQRVFQAIADKDDRELTSLANGATSNEPFAHLTDPAWLTAWGIEHKAHQYGLTGELRSIVETNSDANHRLSDSLEMLAKAITDLSSRIGSERAKASTHEAVAGSGAEQVSDEGATLDAIKALLTEQGRAHTATLRRLKT